MISDCRAGISIEFKTPPSSTSASSQWIVMCPDHAKAQSTDASISISVCAMRTTRSLSDRSASTPAGSENSRIGSEPSAATSPTMYALLVSSSASHPVAIDCIHVPTREIVWPNQNSRKFRCRARVRNGFAERTAVPIADKDNREGPLV